MKISLISIVSFVKKIKIETLKFDQKRSVDGFHKMAYQVTAIVCRCHDANESLHLG